MLKASQIIKSFIIIAALLICEVAGAAPSTLAISPRAQSIKTGDFFVIASTVTGTGPFTYVWKKNGVVVPNQTRDQISFTNVQPSDSGDYSVTVTSMGTSSTSTVSKVFVSGNPPQLNRKDPVSGGYFVPAQINGSFFVQKDAQIVFEPGVTGVAPITYQWRKNDQIIPGATESTYTVPSVQFADAGSFYSCDIFENNGANYLGPTNSITLAVYGPQPLALTPNSTSPLEGTDQSIDVTLQAGYPASTYQWMKNGIDIPASMNATATAKKLVLPKVTRADTGAYAVRLTYAQGIGRSVDANLNVIYKPIILTQTPAVKFTTNVNATPYSIGVTVDAAQPITYKWRKNGTAIANTNSPNFTFKNPVLLTDAGNYSVEVCSLTLCTISGDTKVEVFDPVKITTQPMNLTVKENANAIFKVVATGTALRFQWKKAGTDISGATAASLTIPMAKRVVDEAAYSVTVTNDVSSTDSNSATLTVHYPTVITTQPTSVTINEGQDAVFSVALTEGNPIATYQWTKNTVAITGATGLSLTIPAATRNDAGQYRFVATATIAGTLTNTSSNNVNLVVRFAPSITTQPTNVTVKEGDPAVFTVVTSPGVPATTTFRWRKNGTNIANATAASYTIPATVRGDRGDYSVVVANTVGSVTSDIAKLDVQYAPTITTQPTSVTAAVDTNAMLKIVVDANPAATYVWKHTNPINGTLGDVTGATTDTINFTPVMYRHRGEYSVIVTNALGSVESNKVQVILPPSERGPATVDVLDMTKIKIDRTGGFE